MTLFSISPSPILRILKNITTDFLFWPSQFILRNFKGKMYSYRIMCFSMMGRKNHEMFYDNSFVFGSTGFDPKFVAAW